MTGGVLVGYWEPLLGVTGVLGQTRKGLQGRRGGGWFGGWGIGVLIASPRD